MIRPADAEVEAVRIRLLASLGGSIPFLWEVPAGKVFILEHVAFSDYWDTQGANKQLLLRHGGVFNSGPIWNTTLNYSADFNTLFRPLKLPAGTVLQAPNHNNSSLILFLYGLLVDVSDLYASVPATALEPSATPMESEVEFSGKLELDSARPVAVEVETSEELKAWETAENAEVTATGNSREREFTVPFSGSSGSHFVRISARALLRDDYPPRIRLLPSLALNEENGTVRTPFLSHDTGVFSMESSSGSSQ